MKKEYNSGMEWIGGSARFQVDGAWYRSGIVSAYDKPYIMYGFIERESEDMPPFSECWDEDDEPMTDKERAAAEKVVMRFFHEGYVVREGMFQDFCMVCVLDGEDYPVLDTYANMRRNPKNAEEVWRFYHGE